MSEMYASGAYRELNPTWHVEDSAWKAEQVRLAIERNGLKPRLVCEVGCGAGEILHALADAFTETRFVGYDVADDAARHWRSRGDERVTLEIRDVLAEPAGLSCDLILALDVIEHLDDYRGALRVLRECGEHKLLHIPLDVSAQTVVRKGSLRRLRREVGHLHFFTRETALQALEDAGYDVLDARLTAPAIELSRPSPAFNIAKVPRRIMRRLDDDLAARLLGGFSLLVLAR
jgi:SAM-dependent methyltransferase